jgi:penicillin-binding protein 1A
MSARWFGSSKDEYALPAGYGGVVHDDDQPARPLTSDPVTNPQEEFAPLNPELSKQPSRKWWWIKRGVAASFLMLAIIIIWLATTAPLSKSLEPIAPPQVTLLTADGQPIARNGAVTDKPVKAKDLPDHVKQAFISIEDRRFYSHIGVDPWGIGRALWNNITGGGTQGGSTITQQLAKFTFLTADRTYTRKARELMISFWLEAFLTKDEILERYLSNAYFGDNVYGIRAASLHYFYRQPEKLTLSQAAMLAGLVQAPNRLAPTKNHAKAAKRARMVLNAMATVGYITPEQAKTAPIAQIDVRLRNTLPTGTYFADWAMPKARDLMAETYGDQTIKTTLDSRLQRIARTVVAQNAVGKSQIALVAMRKNGEVVAMIGGRDYKASSFNRATQALRQPGSTFKLFVYLAALRSGMTPDSLVDDGPIEEGLYRPKNAGDSYRGKITLREAFAKSSNVAAVRLYNQLGEAAVVKAAQDLGIKSPLTRDPSLALGTSGVTLLELTSAYAAIANNSWPTRPSAFKTEEPGFFDSIWSPTRSFDSDTHGAMLDLLGAVTKSGTGRGAALGIASYGKTGTSQDSRDALFVGFAGDLVVGVWVGNDDNTPLKGITGGGLPAKIWRSFMTQSVKGASIPAKPKPKPNPKGPIEPLDLPDINIPDGLLNMGESKVDIDPSKGLTLETEIGGVPIDMSLGKDGFDVQTGQEKAGGERPK